MLLYNSDASNASDLEHTVFHIIFLDNYDVFVNSHLNVIFRFFFFRDLFAMLMYFETSSSKADCGSTARIPVTVDIAALETSRRSSASNEIAMDIETSSCSSDIRNL